MTQLKKAVKYKELISQSQEQLQEEEKDLQVQAAKSDLEMTIATTKRDLSNAKRDYEKSKRANPYSVVKERNQLDIVIALEEGLKFAEAILKERF